MSDDAVSGHAGILEQVIVPRLAAGDVRVLVSDTAAGEPEVHWGRTPPMEVTPRDAHTIYEVCWVLEGRCALWLAGRAVALDPHHACIVRPGEPHQLRTTPDLEPFRTFWWRLTATGVGLCEEVFDQWRYARTTSIAATETAAVPRLEAAVRELRARRPHHELLVRGALLELSGHILRGLEEGAAGAHLSEAQQSSWYVQRLIQHVEAHHGADLTLEQLAEVVGLSPSYVTSLFRRHTGRTAMAYVAETRHREALSLLRNTDLSVAEIGRRVGHRDPYYFSRTFKAREGCTPSQYRSLFRGSRPGGAPAAKSRES